MKIRNVFLLSISQALALAGAPLVVFIGGIVGASLAPSPAWATLPVATMVVGVAVFAIPASLIMKAIGRQNDSKPRRPTTSRCSAYRRLLHSPPAR